MEIGDKVKCVEGHSKLVDGDIYTIEYIHSSGNTGDFIAEDGSLCTGWYLSRFESVDVKPSIDELVEQAQKFIGKKCQYKNGAGSTFTPTSVVVFVSEYEANNSSMLVSEYFDKHGLCVALRGGSSVIPMQEVIIVKDSITMDLSKDYKADVYKDKVVVGCQTIPRSKVEEILENMKSFD